MKKSYLVMLLLVSILMSGCTAAITRMSPEDLSIWESSIKYDNSGKPVERFIPVHLFVGAQWDGSQDFSLPEINKGQSPNGAPLRIVGPVKCCGRSKPNAYKRSRESRLHGGFVEQYFIPGIGKEALVLEEQYVNGKQSDKGFAKFPLGWWKSGEKRLIYASSVLPTEITIQKLDFKYMGIPHSLKFRWKIFGSRSRGSNCSYVFSPGRGVEAVSCN